MKIYSWNMLFRNRELDRAFSFIEKLDFDVFCLQEVPQTFLGHLKTLPLHIAYGTEFDLVNDEAAHAYGVVLSRYPIADKRDFALPEYAYPARAKIFLRFMHPWGLRLETNHRGIVAEIDLPAFGRVRIYCLHLTLSQPRQRAREFDAVMARRLPAQADDPSAPMIVCGDFNILERPHITILNWLLGGRIRDILAWRSERRDMEKRFAELKLQNPLRGKPTQTISCSQLDHILVPHDFRIIEAEVLPDRIGSDHHPVYVDCRAENA